MIKIDIHTRTDAFGYSRFDFGREFARILRTVADRAEQEGLDSIVGMSLLDADKVECGVVTREGDGWPTPAPFPPEGVSLPVPLQTETDQLELGL